MKVVLVWGGSIIVILLLMFVSYVSKIPNYLIGSWVLVGTTAYMTYEAKKGNSSYKYKPAIIGFYLSIAIAIIGIIAFIFFPDLMN